MRKRNVQKIVKFAATIMLLIFFHFIGILTPIESFFSKIMNPVLGGFYSISSSLRVAYNENTDKKDLNILLEQMDNQVKELIVKNARLEILEEENKILRDNLKFLTKNDLKHIMANVVSRGGLEDSSEQNTIIIDKGAKDGLYPGLAAVSSQGIIVGKVINVKDNLADVYLITNKECKIAVAIQNEDKTSGIASGDMGLTVNMEFIPQTEKIEIGNIVVASGLEKNIPRGLVIGRVSEVIKENNKLWQNAVIEPIADLDELIMVSVLVP